MIDTPRADLDEAPLVMHWVHEPARGQIQGCDLDGRVLVAIATDPLFGKRLAAAFDPSTLAAPDPAANTLPGYGSAASIMASVASSQAKG